MLCKLNHDALRSIYGDNLFLFELSSDRQRGLYSYFNAFRGHIDGLNTQTIQTALAIIQSNNIDKVFVDGSNLGDFVLSLKQHLPAVEVATFFHNVEARFFWGSFKTHKTARALAVLLANYLAERKSTRWSDRVVCLSERDSRLLKKIYGKSATHISPMALENKCPPLFIGTPEQPPEQFALFVGGTFYANRAGISWFVREVAPRITIPIYIVGRGFETLKSELEIPGKVTVVGAVDSLADWYQRAQFVIAPIFDGSGMKTKVAEALMYGKKVVGTPEAFSGYDDVVEQAGWVCETPDEFVAAITSAQEEVTHSFDHALRLIYEQQYSMAAATDRLRKIFS